MKKLIFIVSFIGTLIFGSSSASAQQSFFCSPSYGGYCQYTGKISQLYVNDANLIIMYFENSVDPAVISNTGISASVNNAGAYMITDNPIYAEYLYSTLITAQASKRPVTIQFFGTTSGYLKLSKVWLAE
ncbi:hypothetical protein GCM10009096_00600 [Parasphingorhabdus litoris]|uniref:Uncharacterized protein n=1 Tax=Parasphingorhabdus litoris TaxID=394733 RepID=A0ABN0ZZP8_9SPHN|nr:hypothetical protein [Parasphingorhabdus litoris]